MSKKDSEKRGQSDKPKKKKNAIVANLEFCCYPIVHRCVKSRGWRVAEKNERWDFGWSDNNQLLKIVESFFNSFSYVRTVSYLIVCGITDTSTESSESDTILFF